MQYNLHLLEITSLCCSKLFLYTVNSICTKKPEIRTGQSYIHTAFSTTCKIEELRCHRRELVELDCVTRITLASALCKLEHQALKQYSWMLTIYLLLLCPAPSVAFASENCNRAMYDRIPLYLTTWFYRVNQSSPRIHLSSTGTVQRLG